jgi:hypothetical protein
MKRKLFLLVAFVFLFGVFALTTRSAYAQSATNAPWTSSITYYTPSPTGATAVISYYAEGSATAVDVVNVTLAGNGAGSIFIGATAVPAGFQGGAVISSSETVVATGVLFAGSGQSGSYGRMLYSGFSESKAADTFFIPTVLYKTFGSTSALGIQNIESTTTQVTLKLYAAGSTTPTSTKVYNIPAQSSQVVSASELTLPVGFSGSATITTPGGRVVAVAQETDDAGRGAYAFEGVASGDNIVYMASMLCNAFGGQNSFYAIQNASLSSAASVEIDFYNTSGTVVASMPPTNISAGGKLSVNPCTQGVPAGTSGSAVITSTGAPIIAIGKVKAPNGLATAFVGESAGYTSSASPYIRWTANASSEFRAYVAVMNVGNAPATNVTATYYDAAGNDTTVALATGATPLAPNVKVNTNAQTAGAVDVNGEFGTAASVAGVGGALEITSDQPVVVVVRLTKAVSLGSTTLFGEDYGATNIAP